ncbi:unnamed protein product [Effrenium voratum]|uniref:Pentatricopeptide repeat-containing protein, chloroplastic n=1 Tax=Effrenium voratum TaxID=2562239 RepID=A0AA36JTF8_9DINO|nr:unnamed protein product [Effrenium voratum]
MRAANAPPASDKFQFLSDKALTACIKRLGNQARWRDVIDIIEETRLQGFQPNTISMNSALTAFTRSYRWAWGILCFDSLEKGRPDMISCGAAIHAYGLGGCWTGAMKIFRSMKFRRLQPDATTFNEALAACERGSQWQDGLTLGRSMPALGLQPDVVTRGSMACALGRGALWRLAVRFRAGSAALGGAIITACASAVQWSWSQEVLGALRRDSEARLQICRGAVLAALARSSRWELACAELQEMWSRVPQEAAPDIRAYNVVISACELSGRWRQALLLLKAARSNKLESDEVSHAAVASACTRRGLAWAFALWMLEVHSGPRDAVLLTTALTACEVGQRWHSAMKLHQAFKGFGLEADEAANLAAAGACQRAACWLQALSYLTPSVSVGNAAIAACRSHWQQGLFLFARMPERDVLSSETQLA